MASIAAAPPVAITHGRVLAIAIPATLANISVPLLGVVNMGVVGRLGEAHLIGAVAVGAMVFDFLFWPFSFLRMGTTGLTAQARGAGDTQEEDAAILRALLIAAGLGLVLVALQPLLLWAALAIIPASPAVAEAAHAYMAIRIFAAPFTFANFAILGWFLGRGQAGIGLALQIALNSVNIALCFALVLGLGYGVEGVAAAALTAEIAAALTGGALVMRARGGHPWPSRTIVLDRARMLATVLINRDVFVRSLALIFAFVFFTVQSAKAGDVTLAANAILHNLFLVGGYFLDGFATAAETLCGQAVGARSRARFVRAVRLTMLWGAGLALVSAAALFLGGPHVIALLTTSETVRAEAALYLPYTALTPIAAVVAFGFDGIYIGATWGRAMRNLMLLSLALYFAACAVLMPLFGNHGLWMSLLVLLVARSVTQSVAYPGLRDRTFAPA